MTLNEEKLKTVWKTLNMSKFRIRNSKLDKIHGIYTGIYKIRIYQTKIPFIPLATLFLKFEESLENPIQFSLFSKLQQHISYRFAILLVDLIIFPILPILLRFKTFDSILSILGAIFLLVIAERMRNGRLTDVENFLKALKKEIHINLHTEVTSKQFFLTGLRGI